jgi:hypothetical protein
LIGRSRFSEGHLRSLLKMGNPLSTTFLAILPAVP